MPQRPEGIPCYGFEGLLDMAGLATITMLRRERRKPAPGQQPCASYFTGYDYALLYRTGDAVDMPPLSPGRQRRYDANRTCAACGRRAKLPWATGPDGRKRYCPTCLEDAHRALWQAEQATRRAASSAWAREVIADPATLLVATGCHGWTRPVRVEDLGGHVLVEVTVRYCQHDPCDHDPTVVPAGALTPREAGVRVLPLLEGRRLISWWPAGSMTLDTSLGSGQAIGAAEPDAFGRRFSAWRGERSIGGYVDPSKALYQIYREVRTQPAPSGPPAEWIRAMRELLATMAEEPAPGVPVLVDGPAGGPP